MNGFNLPYLIIFHHRWWKMYVLVHWVDPVTWNTWTIPHVRCSAGHFISKFSQNITKKEKSLKLFSLFRWFHHQRPNWKKILHCTPYFTGDTVCLFSCTKTRIAPPSVHTGMRLPQLLVGPNSDLPFTFHDYSSVVTQANPYWKLIGQWRPCF